MARHAVVTFLEDRENLQGTDPDFRKLVEVFHRIPFCATFGVSCSGHFNETDKTDEWHPDSFNPSPWGYLDIIVLSNIPHIQELLEVLRKTIATHSDTSFKKIEHPFGPPQNSKLEVWEIRISDNGCLEKFEIGVNWFGESMPKDGNEKEYEDSKKRYQEIKLFWEGLEKEVTDFCRRHEFKRFAPKKRISELVNVCKQKLTTK